MAKGDSRISSDSEWRITIDRNLTDYLTAARLGPAA
jgi:hypothetical protein